MALSCRTFSLGNVLIDYAFGAAIRTTYSDLNDGDEVDQDGMRRVA